VETAYQWLKRVDGPAARKIHPRDQMRIVRALEIFLLTGRPFSEMSRGHGFQRESVRALKFCLHLNREVLYRRIDARSREMLESGLIEETRELLCRGFHAGLKPMNAIGYRHALRYLAGEWNWMETLTNLQRDTRRYAKRQLTWFRKESGWAWVGPDTPTACAAEVKKFYATD
jgi:tRNA dimethylallyltransferase